MDGWGGTSPRRRDERFDYQVVDCEVWFMIGEFASIFDREEF